METPKPRSKGKYRNYGEWQKERKGPLSYQDRLRLAIDTALAERPADLFFAGVWHVRHGRWWMDHPITKSVNALSGLYLISTSYDEN